MTNTTNRKYNVDIEGAKTKVKESENISKLARKEYNLKTAFGTFYNKEAITNLNNANIRVNRAKDDLKFEKIKNKINKENSKSTHRIELEQHYRDKGMTDEEAAVAAYKRDKTEKIIATTVGIGITAAAAYVAYKHYDTTVDKIIKSDTLLSRLDIDGSKSVNDAFYAVMDNNKSDKNTYLGLLGSSRRNQGFDVFQKTISVTDNLKVASEKNALKTLSELVSNDKTYANSLKDDMTQYLASMNFLNSTQEQRETLEKATKSLSDGKINSTVYNAVNIMLGDYNSNTTKGFYAKMVEKGYDAVTDLNDKKFSGFMTKTPMIIFNSSKTSVNDVRSVTDSEITKSKAVRTTAIARKALAITLTRMAAIPIASYTISASVTKVTKSKKNDKIVAEYRKEHPNTNLSYTEIVRNYNDRHQS